MEMAMEGSGEEGLGRKGTEENIRQQSEVEVMVAPGQPDVQPQY